MGVSAEPALAAMASSITIYSLWDILIAKDRGTMMIRATSLVTIIDKKNVVSISFKGIALPFSIDEAIYNKRLLLVAHVWLLEVKIV